MDIVELLKDEAKKHPESEKEFGLRWLLEEAAKEIVLLREEKSWGEW